MQTVHKTIHLTKQNKFSGKIYRRSYKTFKRVKHFLQISTKYYKTV